MDGILLLDKPPGISSNRALQVVRRALGAAKGGHTGNLDVAASGLLPLCFGEATKVCGFLLEADKRYQAVVRLGVVTTTGDAEGEIVAQSTALPTSSASVEAALTLLRGPQLQVPPMYSALKRAGQPLYRLARQGLEVPREPRPITIHALEMLAWQGDTVALDVRCTKGTYIRSLAISLGELLGCGAHLAALRRLEAGPFDITGAHALALFESGRYAPTECAELLLPADRALEGYPAITLDDDAARRLLQGQQPVHEAGLPGGSTVRVYGPGGGFLGLAELMVGGRLRPRRLIATGTVDST